MPAPIPPPGESLVGYALVKKQPCNHCFEIASQVDPNLERVREWLRQWQPAPDYAIVEVRLLNPPQLELNSDAPAASPDSSPPRKSKSRLRRTRRVALATRVPDLS